MLCLLLHMVQVRSVGSKDSAMFWWMLLLLLLRDAMKQCSMPGSVSNSSDVRLLFSGGCVAVDVVHCSRAVRSACCAGLVVCAAKLSVDAGVHAVAVLCRVV